jgi:hypothetical protein
MANKGTQGQLENVLPPHIQEMEKQGQKILAMKQEVTDLKNEITEEEHALLKLMLGKNVGSFNVGGRRFEIEKGETKLKTTKAKAEE